MNQKIDAMKKVTELVDKYKIEVVAIGNGTAARETEAFIKRLSFSHPVKVFSVSEDGASIYSASAVAREEFPEYDVTVRGAVSIGRRLMDPLAELVKIDPKSLGIGQYQHETLLPPFLLCSLRTPSLRPADHTFFDQTPLNLC